MKTKLILLAAVCATLLAGCQATPPWDLIDFFTEDPDPSHPAFPGSQDDNP